MECKTCKRTDVFFLSCCLCYNKLNICDKHETRTVPKYTKRGKWYVRLCNKCVYRKLTKSQKRYIMSFSREHCIWETLDQLGEKYLFSNTSK
jgi:hypothetical protein